MTVVGARLARRNFCVGVGAVAEGEIELGRTFYAREN